MRRKLLRLVEEEGIDVIHWDFTPPVNGFYYYEKGSVPTIGISAHISEGSSLYNCVLAEELGHHYTSSGFQFTIKCFNYSQRQDINRVEFEARKWAALKLMPVERVRQAIMSGHGEWWELMDAFGVTEDVVCFRLGLPDLEDLVKG